MLHIPVLRHGEVYRSLDVGPVPSVAGGEAETSLANAGLLRRDHVHRLPAAVEILRAIPAAERIRRIQAASTLFREGTLTIGDLEQSPGDYARACSASTGLPESMILANIDKLAFVLSQMETVVRGLTRGLDVGILDSGHGEHAGIPVAIVPEADALGAVLPSNSPGVHSLWLPALAFGAPVVLKPGSGDPWTPLRLIAALIAAGLPSEAFGYYPGRHDVGGALVDVHERVLVFGGAETVRKYGSRPGVSVHGPGNSKIIIDDTADWRQHLDVLVDSVARNGGRSCINASTIYVGSEADALAEALAAALSSRVPTALDDPGATLAASANPAIARAIDGAIEDALETPGARSVSATPRCVEHAGLTFLRPSVVRAEPEHPLADREYPFPCVSVVELSPDKALQSLPPTLILALIGDDLDLRRRAFSCRNADRVHYNNVPTTAIRWDQPHEGNLFEWLFRRRAVAF